MFCHHTKILHSYCYWLYSPHCTFHNPRLIYFAAGRLYVLIYLIYFSLPPTPIPFGKQLFFASKALFIFYVSSFFFSKIWHISEIIQYLFFFVWLISLSIISSRSIYVVPKGKVSFFLWMSSIPLHTHTHTYIHTYRIPLFT